MSEGYSDYFAATVLDNPVIGDYFFPQYQRSCDNSFKFPPGFAGEEHAVGIVWAGLLWDLRKELKADADSIVLQSLAYLGPWRSIQQGLTPFCKRIAIFFPPATARRPQESASVELTKI